MPLRLQSLALLTDAQSAWLRSPLLDTEASLLNLTERFDSLHSEICPGCRLLDNFPDHVSFHTCSPSLQKWATETACMFLGEITLASVATTSVRIRGGLMTKTVKGIKLKFASAPIGAVTGVERDIVRKVVQQPTSWAYLRVE